MIKRTPFHHKSSVLSINTNFGSIKPVVNTDLTTAELTATTRRTQHRNSESIQTTHNNSQKQPQSEKEIKINLDEIFEKIKSTIK